MVEFSTWLACPVVARHAIYEVPLRATLLCLAQGLEAARVCAFAARISTFAEHHLEEVARDNSLRRGDGRWRGHHSVDPSERRTERTFGSTGPGRAKLERGGINLDHFGEEIRFENDSVLLAMVGIIATRAESAEAA